MDEINHSGRHKIDRQEMICKITEILQHANMREVTLTYIMLTHLKNDPTDK